MSNYIYKLYHPEIYQGDRKKKNYFEGWYYKLVNDDEELALAIIPGVSIGREEPDHAFIQVLDGIKSESHYYSFPFEQFYADDRMLDIRIDNNHFSKDELKLDLPILTGIISISNIHPIPSSVFSPGIMGWYSFTPFMQCYHGIVSMHHRLSGNLKFQDKQYTFIDGVGYTEKDWGTSFPKCWIWTQCNHFDYEEKISVMASVAHIPWLGTYFVGFIVSLLIGDKIDIFATYNRSNMQVSLQDDHVILAFKKGDKILTLKGKTGPGAELRSPISGLMTGKVNESLQGKIDLHFLKGKDVVECQGRNAGIEIAGDTDILESKEWTK